MGPKVAFDAEAAYQELRTELSADALFAATGKKDTKDAVDICLSLYNINVKDKFVALYEKFKRNDVVGMLFAADARIVERVSAQEITADPSRELTRDELKDRRLFQKYLREDGGFEHLMLAGLDSPRYGCLAWVVVYREPGKVGFSDTERETARHLVPSVLYRHLRELERMGHLKLTSSASPASISGGVVPLSPQLLRIAVRRARGEPIKSIAEAVSKGEQSIRNNLRTIRARLGVAEGDPLTMRHLDDYAGRKKV